MTAFLLWARQLESRDWPSLQLCTYACHAMLLCYAVRCYAMLCDAMLCYATPCYPTLGYEPHLEPRLIIFTTGDRPLPVNLP